MPITCVQSSYPFSVFFYFLYELAKSSNDSDKSQCKLARTLIIILQSVFAVIYTSNEDTESTILKQTRLWDTVQLLVF